MENQHMLVALSSYELRNLIQYLKDFSDITGQSYRYAKDIITKQQIATMNFDLNKMIKKLQNELERNN